MTCVRRDLRMLCCASGKSSKNKHVTCHVKDDANAGLRSESGNLESFITYGPPGFSVHPNKKRISRKFFSSNPHVGSVLLHSSTHSQTDANRRREEQTDTDRQRQAKTETDRDRQRQTQMDTAQQLTPHRHHHNTQHTTHHVVTVSVYCK